MSSLIYDGSALIAAERGVERMWAIHKRALARGVEAVIPSTVLAEVWRGGPGQQQLGQFIRSCEVEPLRAGSARSAGILLAVAPHGVVDVTVVECALRRAAPCVTGDRARLTELAGPRRISIIDI